ncbi:polar growth protein [Rhizopus stolonifer]|uniref:Polar growth protein n=1 Tax=Rhizopus stolonifer TaxID=4846 RepID=A0A367KR50_RHIST|nr:polar growth protein [Rhizopus stolonifer]
MSNLVYAIHSFEAENEDEIDFLAGEPIVVLEKDEKYLDGWWQGRNIKGETGLFPMNYTCLEKPRQYMPSPHLSMRSSRSTVEDEIDDALSHLQMNTKIENWDTKKVAQWLCSVGFESVSHHFIDQEITGDILLDLSIDTLKELGINTFGKRYKIMQAITSLKDEFNVEKLNPHSNQLPPIPNASLSTSAIPHSSLSRSSTRLRRSNSQSTMTSSIHEGGDALYQFPRKAPLPPINHHASDIDTNSLLSVRQSRDVQRPPSPQSLSSSGISRSNTYNTVSSGGSRAPRSRELSPDPKSLNRALSQKGLQHSTIEEHNHWSISDITQGNIKPMTSKSTPTRQPLHTTNTHKLSVSPFEETSSRASTTESFHAPEHEGWLHKQSDKYKTWNKRWFVLKGTNLFYFKSPKEVRMKGIINLRGYRIVTDETIHGGKYCFKAQHESERTFFFYTDSERSMKVWLTVLIKATISRDFRAPVMSSNQMATVPLEIARRMRPRPPSVIMYQKQMKPHEAKISTIGERKQVRESGITHHMIQEEEEESVPEIPAQYLHEEEEDVIDPQHRSLPISNSHQSITSSISEEEEDFDHHHWDMAQYTHWTNSYLPPEKKLVDLAGAFRNGDALILLLEAISQKTIRRPPVQKGGSVSVMMLDNIVAAFKFMGREGVEVDGRYTIKGKRNHYFCSGLTRIDVFGGNEEKIMTMLDAIKEWADANYTSPKKQHNASVLISEEDAWRGSAMMDQTPLSDDEY